MTDEPTSVTKQPESNKLTGFQLHPEHINRDGRPKKEHTLTDLMRQMMEDDPAIKRAMMAKLMSMASKGDIAAIREVLDRLEGKPLQSIESKDITELSLTYGHPKPDEPPAKAGGSDTDASQPKV